MKPGISSDENNEMNGQIQCKCEEGLAPFQIPPTPGGGGGSGGGGSSREQAIDVVGGGGHAPQPQSVDSGHYTWIPGEIISGGAQANRYALLEALGQGGYGRVLKALNLHTNKFFALKIIRRSERYYDAGYKEIGILNMLNQVDPKQRYVSTNVLCQFQLEGHICFGLELLGISVYDYMKMNPGLIFPLTHIRHMLFQLVHAIQFLHTHGVIHTDIKLDNILFAHSYPGYSAYATPPGCKYLSPRCTRVLLTDFGAAKAGGCSYIGVITTRTTRAPEVILGTSWGFPVDIWALGCVLFQLHTGVTLFSVWDDLSQLYLVEQVTGSFPKDLIDTGTQGSYFTLGGYVDDQQMKPHVKVGLDEHAKNCNKLMLENLEDPSFRGMVDLLYLMLKNDPLQRITAPEIMKHGFIELLPVEFRLQHGLANPNLALRCCTGCLTGVTCDCVECDKYRDKETPPPTGAVVAGVPGVAGVPAGM